MTPEAKDAPAVAVSQKITRAGTSFAFRPFAHRIDIRQLMQGTGGWRICRNGNH